MERENPMYNPNGNVPLDDDRNTRPTFTVEPETVEGCDCPDCLAGKHIYSLYRWTEIGWRFAATSLQSYSSAEECKQKHWWGIIFGPNAVWEDGQPVVEPVLEERPDEARVGGKVVLDTEALQKSAELLEKHWGILRE
jgi:hypothetical protein